MLGHFKLLTWPVSVLAIVTPWWLPVLENASQYAALLLPIAGVLWLGLQMGMAVWDRIRRRSNGQ